MTRSSTAALRRQQHKGGDDTARDAADSLNTPGAEQQSGPSSVYGGSEGKSDSGGVGRPSPCDDLSPQPRKLFISPASGESGAGGATLRTEDHAETPVMTEMAVAAASPSGGGGGGGGSRRRGGRGRGRAGRRTASAPMPSKYSIECWSQVMKVLEAERQMRALAEDTIAEADEDEAAAEAADGAGAQQGAAPAGATGSRRSPTKKEQRIANNHKLFERLCEETNGVYMDEDVDDADDYADELDGDDDSSDRGAGAVASPANKRQPFASLNGRRGTRDSGASAKVAAVVKATAEDQQELCALRAENKTLHDKLAAADQELAALRAQLQAKSASDLLIAQLVRQCPSARELLHLPDPLVLK